MSVIFTQNSFAIYIIMEKFKRCSFVNQFVIEPALDKKQIR